MRQLASIQTIKYLKPIENADLIEVAGVLGWEIVVKKGEFQVGGRCVMCEIDSWVPHQIAPFLSKGKEPRIYNGVKGERLKSCRLRGTLSQGLILSLNVLPNYSDLNLGDDVTDILGIEKYEPPIPAQIQGDARSFIWPINKTDEERVQNNDKYRFIEALWGRPYYISLKLDGTSSTFLVDPKDDVYHVCGRNFSYKEKPAHKFWELSFRYDIETKLRQLKSEGKNIAIQTECVGVGIQSNKLNLSENDLYVFNVVNIDTNTKLPLDQALEIVAQLGLKFAPVLERGEDFRFNIEDCLRLAEGKYAQYFSSAKPNQEREGVVFRSLDSTISFKAISNKFLLKEDQSDTEYDKQMDIAQKVMKEDKEALSKLSEEDA